MKILFLSDNPFSGTGYGVYGKNILPKIAQHHEVALISCWQNPEDPRFGHLPYKVYGNGPKNKNEEQIFNKDQLNGFGLFRFREVCLDFKPDIVCSWRDTLDDMFLYNNPYRDLYHLINMPTYDAYPMPPQYIEFYMRADAILSWTDWAGQCLIEQCNKIPYMGSAPPGAPEEFKPLQNGGKFKQFFKNKFVVGSVMRNQKRKLFPELISGFKKFLNESKSDSALYLHTGYPDKSCWDIPKLIMEAGIANKTYFTYGCANCGLYKPNLWTGSISSCPNCYTEKFAICNSERPAPNQVMTNVYNAMDVYIQYSYNEGFGMPLIEAALCGVPIVGQNYSGTGELVKNAMGSFIDSHLFIENLSERYLSMPKTESLVKVLMEYYKMPEEVRSYYGVRSINKLSLKYNYDIAAKKWLEVISQFKPKNLWNSPARKLSIDLNQQTNYKVIQEAIKVLNLPKNGWSHLSQTNTLDIGESDIDTVAKNVKNRLGVFKSWEDSRIANN